MNVEKKRRCNKSKFFSVTIFKCSSSSGGRYMPLSACNVQNKSSLKLWWWLSGKYIFCAWEWEGVVRRPTSFNSDVGKESIKQSEAEKIHQNQFRIVTHKSAHKIGDQPQFIASTQFHRAQSNNNAIVHTSTFVSAILFIAILSHAASNIISNWFNPFIAHEYSRNWKFLLLITYDFRFIYLKLHRSHL